MNNWREDTIGNICLKVTDGSHYSPKELEDGYPMFSVKDMAENGFDYSDVKRISQEDFKRLVKGDCKPKKDDVLIAKDGSYLKHVFVCEEERDEVILSSIAILRPNKEKINPDFFKHLLRTPSVKGMMESFVSGSALPRIVLKDFKKMKLSLPPLPTQQRIASILSAYDDLIEVNNQRIKLLEQTARELYKEWFVRMRFPGYKQAKFKKGVPEGWEVVKLGELVKPQYGYTESSVKNDSLPKFLRVMDINKTSYVDWENVPNCPITENEFKKYRLVKDDLIIARMADPGKVAIIENDVNAVFALYLIRLKIISNDIKPYWLFYTLGSDYFQGTFVNADSSSTRGSINGPTICGVKILLPTKNIIEDFDINVRPFREMISLLVQQNTQLRQIRDRLLPRLISGKLKVSEL